MADDSSLRAVVSPWHRRLRESGVEIATDSEVVDARFVTALAPIAVARSLLTELIQGLPPDVVEGVESIMETMNRVYIASSSKMEANDIKSAPSLAANWRQLSIPTHNMYLSMGEKGPRESKEMRQQHRMDKAGDLSGLHIDETSLGRRPSSSYRLYDRMGGWETLSAAVTGVYSILQQDERVRESVRAADERQLKTHMLDFLSFASGGCLRGSDSPRLWENHNQTMMDLGLGPLYFDVMMEALETTLSELNLPSMDVANAIKVLKANRAAFELCQSAKRTSQHVNHVSGVLQ